MIKIVLLCRRRPCKFEKLAPLDLCGYPWGSLIRFIDMPLGTGNAAARGKMSLVLECDNVRMRRVLIFAQILFTV